SMVGMLDTVVQLDPRAWRRKADPCLRLPRTMLGVLRDTLTAPPGWALSCSARLGHCHTLIVFSRHKLHSGCPARRLEHIAGVCSSGRCGPSSPILARAFSRQRPCSLATLPVSKAL